MNRIQKFFRNQKWKRQRAKGTLPECDLWDFHTTLVDHIQQGCKYLLREDGRIDYTADKNHKEMKKALEFILAWTEEFPKMLDYIPDDGEWESYAAYQKKYEKMQTKAFKLIDKYLMGMWD